jgi:hypothetical protein
MNRAGLTARKSLQNHLEVHQIAHWQALNLSLVAKFVCHPRYSPFTGTRATTGERTAIVKKVCVEFKCLSRLSTNCLFHCMPVTPEIFAQGVATIASASNREGETRVRFTPESGHMRRTSSCQLSARSGHAKMYGLGSILAYVGIQQQRPCIKNDPSEDSDGLDGCDVHAAPRAKNESQSSDYAQQI